MDSIVVMITGIGGGGHGEQILKALKMANTPYKFIGGDMNKYSQGLCNVDYPYILPPATSPNYMDAILNICRKHNVQALFHGSEPELRVFSENRQAIQKEGIFLPINPVEVIDLCMNKYRTFQWLKEHGFSVPETKIINEINQLDEINVFPVVLKPFIGGGGSNNIFIAQNRSEIIMIGGYLFNAIGPFIVQEYIGTVDNEFTVGVLVDMDGNFINSVAVNRTILSGLSNRIKMRNKTGLDKFGEYLVISSGISQGKIGAYPEVTATCEEIAVQLGNVGFTIKKFTFLK